MTQEQEYIVRLSKAAIYDEKPPDPPEGIDWDRIWDKALTQNITGLLATAIVKLPEDKQPEDAEKWKDAAFYTVTEMAQKDFKFERMHKLLKEYGIDPICLKGVEVKELYPEPCLRSMGDFDILIEREDKKQAEQLFAKEGYKTESAPQFFTAHSANILWEVFDSLEQEFKKDTQKWDADIRKHTVISNGKRILAPTYELAYSIIHTGKHLLCGGCGIRNLCDAALIIKNREGIDFKKVHELCAVQGYEKVLAYVISILERWYDLDIQIQIARRSGDNVLEYMLETGIFGASFDNFLIRQASNLIGPASEQDKKTAASMRKAIFPPRDMLGYRYRYAKKFPVLMPIAWLHRCITVVFVKKYSFKAMTEGIKKGKEFRKEQNRKLKELDLID